MWPMSRRLFQLSHVLTLQAKFQAKKHAVEKIAIEKQRNRVVTQIDRLVTAISDTAEPLPGLLQQLKERVRERVGLEESLRQLKGESNVVTLHPNVIEEYQANVEKLHAALTRNPDDQENHIAFRNLIDSIVVHPTEYRAPYEVDVNGRLSAIMGVDLYPTVRSTSEILAAEEGLTMVDKGHPA